MSKEPMNPPAYPQPIGLNGYVIKEPTGMTLRDYFAAKALAPIMQRNTTDYIQKNANAMGVSVSEAFASAAYELADAMLKARQS